jgi:allophanate hydrolase
LRLDDAAGGRACRTMSPQAIAATDVAALAAAYASGGHVRDVLGDVYARIDADDPVWISVVPAGVALERARYLDSLAPEERAALPLFGIPFAVKDNIDLAGVPTTAGCPAFAFVPERSATVVQRLEEAGAIAVGKTNLDQFATGLVGTRSPYGVPENPFGSAYIPGGSSSGSAVAVARGLVSFALGTDTAGSGRVPAGFTGTVGVKPTHGIISSAGVVPACRSLDCVSIFARTIDDAAAVLAVAAAQDPCDPYSRFWAKPDLLRSTEPDTAHWAKPNLTRSSEPDPTEGAESAAHQAAQSAKAFAVAVPQPEQRLFFGDAEAEQSFERTVARLCALGGTPVSVDMRACFETAALLYEGPFVAERTAAVGDFVDAHPEAVLDVTRTIVQSGRRFSAVDTFRALYELRSLRRRASVIFEQAPILVVPTSPTIYRRAEIAAEPYLLNARLGTYTNFVNLLDLCALAVPSDQYANGVPIGVTFIAPAFHDAMLLNFARRFLTNAQRER